MSAPPRNLAPTSCRDSDIAIIGMACRFPGADNLEAFWRNLRDGVESITFFSEQELLAAGVEPDLLRRPNYVRANSILPDAELFDAPFFGYSAREAEVLDLQQRIFLECAWHAIEDAGFDPRTQRCSCGVYAGAGLNTYFWNCLAGNPNLLEAVGGFQLMLANDKDYLATRVSYKLGLCGPSITVQTACSTSLVAVHLACQALLAGECDVALAGAVSVRVPQIAGYLHQEGMILSPDGHCRAFDARAAGIVGGSGAGIVVLKRLADALGGQDSIRAVIRGSAVNNDGSQKLGYTAPSVEGQEAVIAEAIAVAEVEAESIGYIEAHGTGTPLGDPAEITALTRAFRTSTNARGFCAIGSVKTNIGHLDTAAGIAGLIKTVLVLEHGTIPPSLHFEQPNPQIDFESSPFRVSTALGDWPRDGCPRRAGVSSFGIGGTNAHVILEEAPPPSASHGARPYCLLPLSAHNEASLAETSANLAAHLREKPEISLADVAYTLSRGRRAFCCRRVVLCSDSPDEAIAALVERDSPTARPPESSPGVVFLFPGQGGQQCGEIEFEFYEQEPVFREEIDRCAKLLLPHLGFDLRASIQRGQREADRAHTAVLQPALFAVEYALARLWMSWGIQPSCMIGHSLGEYVAACLADVFSLEDALRLVAIRGKLMQDLPEGEMLALGLPEAEAAAMLGSELSLAAVNGPCISVVSGPKQAIQQLQRSLSLRGVASAKLNISHAFHSRMMEPILDEFSRAVGATARHEPSIPIVSNLSGTWITPEQAVDPSYWVAHLRRTVRFSDGLATMLSGEATSALLEIGHGRTLANLAVRHPSKTPTHTIVATLGQPRRSASRSVLAALGQLWLAGVEVQWDGFFRDQRRRHLALPGYPFQRQRYWVEPTRPSIAVPIGRARKPIEDWFLMPSWRRSPLMPGRCTDSAAARWLLFLDGNGLGSKLGMLLRQAGHEVVLARPGAAFRELSSTEYELDLSNPDDYTTLLASAGSGLTGIVHFWNITPAAGASDCDELQARGFYSLLALAQAFGRRDDGPLELLVVCSEVGQIGDERIRPEKATLLGPVRVISKEYPHICSRCVDIGQTSSVSEMERLGAQLCQELLSGARDCFVAYRGAHRWVQELQPVQLPVGDAPLPLLKDCGVYLITGGLGGIGLTLAHHLAQIVRAKLVLISRSELPPRAEWENELAARDEDDPLARKLAKLQVIEALGAECLVLAADVASETEMRTALEGARQRFGRIDGVVHAAGVPSGGMIQRKERDAAKGVLSPKVTGTLVLEKLFADSPPDFMVLASSISTFLGEFGQVDYCAANAFLDAFAQAKACSAQRVISINWDTWEEVGMAVDARKQFPSVRSNPDLRPRILPHEGVEALRRILASGLPQVVVATHDFEAYRAQHESAETKPELPTSRHARPETRRPFTAPRDEAERLIAEIWEELLGISPVGIDDDFFELGGHSLLATQVIARVHKACGAKLTLATFFDAPTVAGLVASAAACGAEKTAEPTLARVSRTGRLPLSYQQEALWLLDRMDGSSVQMNELGAQTIHGPLDAALLRGSFEEILRRHEVLRARFVEHSGEPTVEIAPETTVELSEIDLSVEAPAGSEEAVRAVAAKMVARPFDLERGPLLRASLMRLGEAHFVLLTVVHHIAFDGWSSGILFREMHETYAALARQERPELAPLTLQYTDYAVWQRDMLQGLRRERLTNFWREQLRGPLPVLALPADYPRPPTQSFGGKKHFIALDRLLMERLEELGRSHGWSLFMVLLAGYGALLGRYAAQDDVIVGCPVAGRERRELEPLVGFFVNLLPMRIDLRGDPTFVELLSQVRATVLAAYEHQALPFELIVDALQPTRDQRRHVIFQTILAFQNTMPLPSVP